MVQVLEAGVHEYCQYWLLMRWLPRMCNVVLQSIEYGAPCARASYWESHWKVFSRSICPQSTIISNPHRYPIHIVLYIYIVPKCHWCGVWDSVLHTTTRQCLIVGCKLITVHSRLIF